MSTSVAMMAPGRGIDKNSGVYTHSGEQASGRVTFWLKTSRLKRGANMLSETASSGTPHTPTDRGVWSCPAR